MAEEIIQLSAVHKEFFHSANAVSALSDITFNVKENEFVSIVGPSGCGKTTLLKLIGGLISPTSGEITVKGNAPNVVRKNREFAFVFQDPALFPWRTVAQNIQLPGEILNIEDIKYRVRELIELVDLSGFEHSLPRDLSGGMKSRVAIARALSFQPSFLLMDEPFGSLDEITRDKMHLELLKIWEKTKTTIIFVTHSISEAVFLSDRIIVMTSRPGTIKKDHLFNFDRPRNVSIRKDPQFTDTVEFLKECLGEEATETN